MGRRSRCRFAAIRAEGVGAEAPPTSFVAVKPWMSANAGIQRLQRHAPTNARRNKKRRAMPGVLVCANRERVRPCSPYAPRRSPPTGSCSPPARIRHRPSSA
ncbi:DUF6053 domain-containing protein [Lysobacter yananisis]|uniref:DUF6053 domain-containing protein n=1 Tax=Lysobacter yananisis TaxID=1003114 RepID=UPI003CE4FB51